MAQLTRDQFVTELKVRGYRGFDDAEIQKYVDFALRDVVREFKIDDLADLYENAAPTAALDTVAFAVIEATDEIVEINQVWAERKSGEWYQVTSADKPTFDRQIYPNALRDVGTPLTGAPSFYYVEDDTLYLFPSIDTTKIRAFRVRYFKKHQAFGSGASNSDLPERYDEAILAFAEMHCARRARDWDAYGAAAGEARRLLDLELVNENREWGEEFPRVLPYR